jgi:hypothetical protein
MRKILFFIPLFLWTCGGGGGSSPTEPEPPQLPTVQNINLTATEDTPKVFTFVGTDPLNSALSYSVSTQPQHGTVVISGGSGTYTPNANYNGQDIFLYLASSVNGSSNIGTVVIDIAPVDDQPIPIQQQLTTQEDTNLKITFQFEEYDGQDVWFSWGGGTQHGTINFDDQDCSSQEIGDKTCTKVSYGPNGNYFGDDSFLLTVHDVNSRRILNQSNIRITVTPVNDAPSVDDINNVEVSNGQSVDITLTGSDVENDNLTFEIVDQPSLGSVSLENNIVTFSANSPGQDSFTYKAYDGTDYSNISTVSIEIKDNIFITYLGMEYGSTPDTISEDIVELLDGGFVIVGNDWSAGYGSNEDLFMIKVDSQGNEEWKTRIGNSNLSAMSESGESIILTNDGNLLAVGNNIIVKTDLFGNIIWSKFSEGTNNQFFWRDAKETNDGHYIISGYSPSQGRILLKIDYQGNIIWQKELQQASGINQTTSVIVVNDGYVALVIDQGNQSYRLNKVDLNGEELWTNEFTGIGESFLPKMKMISDGILVVGNSESYSSNGIEEAYLSKFDFDGNQQWVQTYHDSENQETFGFDVIETQDGNLAIGGFTRPWFTALLIITDSNGNELSQTTFPASGGGTWINSLIEDSQNRIVFAGIYQWPESSPGVTISRDFALFGYFAP